MCVNNLARLCAKTSATNGRKVEAKEEQKEWTKETNMFKTLPCHPFWHVI